MRALILRAAPATVAGAAIALGAPLLLAPAPPALAAALVLALIVGTLASCFHMLSAALCAAGGCAALLATGALAPTAAAWCLLELLALAAAARSARCLAEALGATAPLAAATATLLVPLLSAALPLAIALLPPRPRALAWLQPLLALSPPAVLGASILGHDVLRWPALYVLGTVTQSGPWSYPPPWRAVASTAAAAATLAAAARVLRTLLSLLRLRNTADLTPREPGRRIALGAVRREARP